MLQTIIAPGAIHRAAPNRYGASAAWFMRGLKFSETAGQISAAM
jgi:hypothetical protein